MNTFSFTKKNMKAEPNSFEGKEIQLSVSEKSESVHGTMPLFIGARYNLVWNYKHIHISHLHELQTLRWYCRLFLFLVLLDKLLNSFLHRGTKATSFCSCPLASLTEWKLSSFDSSSHVAPDEGQLHHSFYSA